MDETNSNVPPDGEQCEPMSECDDDIPICIICQKAVHESGPDAKGCRTLKTSAIEKLRSSSLQRRDGMHKRIPKDTDTIIVHDSCRSSYNRLPSTESKSLQTSKSSTRKTSIRAKPQQEYLFKEKCLFCDGDASDDYEKQQRKNGPERARKVARVQDDSTRISILKLCKERNDHEGALVYARIESVPDLIKVGARYHYDCYPKFAKYRLTDDDGNCIDSSLDKATQFIIQYILENDDDCQFSLQDLIEKSGEVLTDWRTIKDRLNAYFFGKIVFSTIRKDCIITFLGRSKDILADFWMQKRSKDENAERAKIVTTAAKIILNDIQSKVYDVEYYKAPSNFLVDIDSDVPQSLKSFLEIIMKGTKKDSQKWDAKVCAASHIIISAARPRTFISSLLLGLSSVIHKQHASRKLIDNLSFVGFCASYRETMLFEASLVKDPESFKIEDAFIQFAFDNADENTQTLDGYGTFHVMGGIKIVTPHSKVTSQNQIKRLKNLPKAIELGKEGTMELQKYNSPVDSGLNKVIMEIVGHGANKTPLNLFNSRDLTWLYGKSSRPEVTKGFNSYMQLVSELQDFQVSRVLSLPIVNNPPSELDTVYTVLLYADRQARIMNQKHVPVTLDHPLYMKSEIILENEARDTTKSEDEKLRCFSVIGLFHLLMSTSNSISSTMDGSGLRDVFGLIYAQNSLDAILSGKAHDRAMRGHKLVMISLATLILREVEWFPEEIATLNNFLDNLENPEFDIIEILESDVMQAITKKFLDTCEKLKQRSPTAGLWIQYFGYAILLCKIIDSLKRGDWNLLMDCLKHTLPLFHATAHLNYAKATHLFLQKMLSLETIMDPIEYDLYTRQQYFTIRRKNVFYSGNPQDLTIEQVFMRTMKVAGGLTHGRGRSSSVLARFIMSMIVLTDVTYAIEFFCSHGYANSEQFSDDRKSSIKRDAQDLEKIIDYLTGHNPFEVDETESVISISTGLRGDEKVNCHQVIEVGTKLLTGTFGKKFGDIKLQRKTRVISLASAQSSITVDNDSIRIDPTLLFQRLSLLVENRDDMKEYLKLELAPYPKSLFDQDGMVKTPKSKFMDHFTPLSGKPNIAGLKYVVDGGFLLHRVVWSCNELVDDILKKYVTYVALNYSQGSIIVFDGYPTVLEARHIKSLERARRVNQNQSREVQIKKGLPIPIAKDLFLKNEKNKNRLIRMIMSELEGAGYVCKQACEDADVLIVTTAVEIWRTMSTPTMIVGEDTDLPVILTQLTDVNDEVYFFKPGKGKTPHKYYSCSSFESISLRPVVAFLHAFSGCDTVSAMFGKGKVGIVKLFQKNLNLVELAEKFNDKDAGVQDLINNGIIIISRIYDPGSDSTDLDEMRYRFFRAKTTKLSFGLEHLPPSNKAAKQHILRAYFQVQLWIGNDTIKATDFGWFESVTSSRVRCLKPLYVEDNILIPPKLMEQISCGCKKGCSNKKCSCVRVGMPCTDLCKSCHGTNCENTTDFPIEVPTDDPNIDDDGVEILNDFRVADQSTQIEIDQTDQTTLTEYRQQDESTSTEDSQCV
ncbi:hypothetical protein QAD02_013994 [Eretmocerus hayati]|uniref:Uncharacterized protein n=1 Tax=Eretmocerus hayati TaxID=131215 RepID=A0ACC2P6X4_9HYME|nr:hypothetical protein QAD02_013994 [Eretmocerus hayati]